MVVKVQVDIMHFTLKITIFSFFPQNFKMVVLQINKDLHLIGKDRITSGAYIHATMKVAEMNIRAPNNNNVVKTSF